MAHTFQVHWSARHATATQLILAVTSEIDVTVTYIENTQHSTTTTHVHNSIMVDMETHLSTQTDLHTLCTML